MEINKTIAEKFREKSNIPGDINEHLDTLRRYSSECDHIVEMGVRSVVSTWAFLMGKPKSLLSIDLYDPSFYNSNDLSLAELSAQEEGIDFKFLKANVLDIEIPECDLLFIDTLHNYSQIKKELELHAPKVRKYIAFHDTETFRNIGETPNEIGIWPAIEEFLTSSPEWTIKEVFTNNNGLTIITKNEQ